MNHKIIDNLVGFMSGVFGGGISYTLQISWHDEALKLAIASVTAIVAGGCGVAGKYLFAWSWKKLRTLFTKK